MRLTGPLPADLREKVASLEAIHDASHNSSGELRKGVRPVTDVSNTPGAKHPMLRTHPETGRKALYLGRRRNAYVADLAVEESERVLDTLWQAALHDRYSYTHQLARR